jgi:hypothetical protein
MSRQLFDNLKEDFLKCYLFYKHKRYVWTAKDNKHLGLLIRNMRAYHNNELDTEKMRTAIREYFKSAFKLDNSFYWKYMSIPLLSSKFNEIMSANLQFVYKQNIIPREPRHNHANLGIKKLSDIIKAIGNEAR